MRNFIKNILSQQNSLAALSEQNIVLSPHGHLLQDIQLSDECKGIQAPCRKWNVIPVRWHSRTCMS